MLKVLVFQNPILDLIVKVLNILNAITFYNFAIIYSMYFSSRSNVLSLFSTIIFKFKAFNPYFFAIFKVVIRVKQNIYLNFAAKRIVIVNFYEMHVT